MAFWISLLESDADLVAATTDAGGPFLTAAAMTLHRFASLALKSRIDARKRLFSGKSLHRFASLSLKSRIDAAFGLFLRVSLHRFPSLGLKSRIDARKRLFSGKTLHRFSSLHLEALTVAAERVLIRPEAAYPYVSAAEGAQHPPKRPPRSTTTAGGVSRWKGR